MKTPDEYMKAAEENLEQALIEGKAGQDEYSKVFSAISEAYATMAAAAANIECMKMQREMTDAYKESVNHGSQDGE